MPRKNSKTLTDPGIAKIGKAPKGKRKELFDALAPGLSLRVTETGSKSWSCYYSFGGKHQRMTIGRWPGIGVAEARDRAGEVKEQAKAGVNPKDVAQNAKDATKAKAEAAKRTTFGHIAELYIRRQCSQLKNGSSYTAVIKRELLPKWAGRQMADLRRGDLTAITDAIIDSGRPAAAHRVFEIVKTMFNWAADRGDVEFSPFAAMRPPVSKVARDRVLTDAEIPLVWRGTDTLQYPFGPLVKLLLLTGQRRDEVALISWREIDLEKREWLNGDHRSAAEVYPRRLPVFHNGRRKGRVRVQQGQSSP
jgi:integrase